jgi:CRP/FNR family transcriptional regulator
MSAPIPARHQVFSRIALFSALTPAELQMLADRAVDRAYQPGESLFYEGDPCTGLYILGSGSVKIVKASPSGREIMLAVESAPSSVAEVPVFDGGPYPATVTALDQVHAWHLGKSEFFQVCREHPEVAIKVLAVVGRRLRQLVSVVERVTFGSIRQRLARTLLDFAASARSSTFALPVTHEEMAQRLGTVREVVSRNLSRFQAEGFLRVQRREIEILDRAALEREAETEL